MMKSLCLSLLLAITAAASDVTIRPCLPVHLWSQGRHDIGLLSSGPRGGFRKFVSEETTEPDRDGYWIEAAKVLEIRKFFPGVTAAFSFGEPVTVGGIKYVRVRQVPEPRDPPGREARNQTSPRHVRTT
jgi:hypothetical protein